VHLKSHVDYCLHIEVDTGEGPSAVGTQPEPTRRYSRV